MQRGGSGMRRWSVCLIGVLACVGWAFEGVAQAQSASVALGGPRGVVHSSKGFPIEGMMVQLISQKTAIRTTVFTNETGRYEFPKLESGAYTLRTPRPQEYGRYLNEQVQIDGAARLEDIVLTRITDEEFLPPTPDVLSQLTDAEWLFNLPGTAMEKKIFSNSCGGSCHSYQMPFRSKFDERSWRLILHRMKNYGGRLVQRQTNMAEVTPEDHEYIDILAKWLARVRGPDATYPPIKMFPRPQGPATRVVITEYEIPTVGVHVHDVAGDPDGNIWYTINRSPMIGRLDPKTGAVQEWRTPGTEGKHPGGHWIRSTKDGMIWYSETWSQSLIQFDPKTEEFHKMRSGVQGNMALSPDGSIWRTGRGAIHEFNRETGQPLRSFEMKKFRSTYGNFVSWDGNYFGGGVGGAAPSENDGIVWMDIRTGEVREIDTTNGPQDLSRGTFDPAGNIWVGGKHGVLAKYDPKTNIYSEYTPPTPYATMYNAEADKNGIIWAGEVRAGKMGRFDPKTQQWIEYWMAEPFSHNWNTYVDNTTSPVTVWYGDQYGYIVRVQPLE